jgi:hypothetical protein
MPDRMHRCESLKPLPASTSDSTRMKMLDSKLSTRVRMGHSDSMAATISTRERILDEGSKSRPLFRCNEDR